MVHTGNPLNIKTSPKFTFGEMLITGVVKSASERAIAATPLGNGNYRSGAAKLGAAFLAYTLAGRKGGAIGSATNIASTAWTIDGVEDLISAAVRTFGIGQQKATVTSNAI